VAHVEPLKRRCAYLLLSHFVARINLSRFNQMKRFFADAAQSQRRWYVCIESDALKTQCCCLDDALSKCFTLFNVVAPLPHPANELFFSCSTSSSWRVRPCICRLFRAKFEDAFSTQIWTICAGYRAAQSLGYQRPIFTGSNASICINQSRDRRFSGTHPQAGECGRKSLAVQVRVAFGWNRCAI
jgi:hypothetical protein